jgi:transaldolase
MTMKKNPLLRLRDQGQSVWLDYIHRKMIHSGELRMLMREAGLRGITSNPQIFETAISGSDAYDDDILALASEENSPEEIYEHLAVQDVRDAARVLRPLYDRSDGRGGFVSLEVNPHLAHDTYGTIEEARRLWKRLDSPNVLIKVPGTREGLPAIETLIGEGINVNVTLLFGLPRYREVTDAYIAGLEERVRSGQPLEHVASVASFFLSRIDVLIDPRLERIRDGSGPESKVAEELHGEIAIASAKMAYQVYKSVFGGDRFRRLAEQGARPQRVLWASTSTKNPEYSDVKYIDALIGPETVNTMPRETLDAYRDHGRPAPRLEEDLDKARAALERLSQVGIDIDQVTQQLEDDGVEKFNRPFDKLIASLKEKCRQKAASR